MHHRPLRNGSCLAALTVLAVSVAGCCCGSTGGGLSLLPTGHRLTPAAYRLAAHTSRPAPVGRELEKTVVPLYVVQPGDGLLIEPYDFDSAVQVPADQPVLPDGMIDLGRFGRIVVAGHTLEQIESLVSAAVKIEEPHACRFNVRLVNPSSAVYYVLGHVNSPGSYHFTGRETVLDAILMAGGLSEQSSRCDIVLSRPSYPGDCRTVLPVCYDHIVQLGDTTTNYQLAPGDRIYVASRSCWQDLLACCLKCDCSLCGGCCAPTCGGAMAMSAPPVTFALPSPADAALQPVPDSGAPGPTDVEMVPPAPAGSARRPPVAPPGLSRVE